MSAFALRCRALALAAALAAPVDAQDVASRVDGLFQAGRYGAALELTQDIEDAALRAEWRFQLLNTGGDLPGALEAALEGLRAAPQHLGLLQNALVCALTLGHAELSRALCARWKAAIEAQLDDPARRAAALERQASLQAVADEAARRELALSRATARARVGALSALAAALLALLGLAWRATPAR